MGVKLDGIDISTSIINLEYLVERLMLILAWIEKNNPVIAYPPKEVIEEINGVALSKVCNAHPETKIEMKS